MSRRPQILAGCLRLLACGSETTRDLSLHVGAPRALVAVVLHGEPGVTREGDVWTWVPAPAQVEQVRELAIAAPPRSRGGDCRPIVYLRDNPGWHVYTEIADECGVSYSAVAFAVKRYQGDLKFSSDERRRVLVAWKGAAVRA